MNPKFSREVSLLLIGAAISLVASIITSVISYYHDSEKDINNKKIALLNQVSSDYGDRVYITREWYRAKITGNAKADSALKIRYENLREQWNKSDYSYKPLITHYFGATEGDNYKYKIYDPMISMGNCIDNMKIDTTTDRKLTALVSTGREFFQRLYDQCDR